MIDKLFESVYNLFEEDEEKVNYEIIKIVQNENVELAYNTQNLYVKNS